MELRESNPCFEIFTPPQHEQAAARSFSCNNPIFYNLAKHQRGNKTKDQRGIRPRDSQHSQHKYVLHGGHGDPHEATSSSAYCAAHERNNSQKFVVCKGEDEDESKKDIDESVKWVPPKMRLMRKMMNSNCSGADKSVRIVQKLMSDDHQQDYGERNLASHINDSVRVCADCNTAKTPLWRSGPQGPKSLCNACGIRQRKARRAAMAAAANGSDFATHTSSLYSNKVKKKEKKAPTSYVTQHKKRFKLLCSPQCGKRLSFEDFALSLTKNSSAVFPREQVEAAILLMELSCGLVCT